MNEGLYEGRKEVLYEGRKDMKDTYRGSTSAIPPWVKLMRQPGTDPCTESNTFGRTEGREKTEGRKDGRII
jgi:hypothetical protein